MERVKIINLAPGQSYHLSLFSLTGQKLLNAGTELSERHIQAIRRCSDIEVVLAQSVEELVEAGLVERFDVSKLRVGQRLQRDLLTRAGQVVLEADQEVEEHHLDALAAGGNAFALTKKPADQRRERILMGDALMEELDQAAAKLVLRVTPEQGAGWQTPAPPASWPVPDQLARTRTDAVETLRGYYARIEAGLPVPLRQFDPLVDELLAWLAHHPTRFTQVALLCPRREDYLPDHAYTVAALSMAVAAQLRWPKADVRQVGLAGLLYDLGMLLVPERIRAGACQLTDIDRSRVQRHPVFTLSMLQAVEDVPPLLRLAALQHHERENGSGYPRGARRDATCDYARVLAVADTFAATTEPRHYRRPKLPYIAMEETLRSASVMAFWKPGVRGLVQAAGLFPVGSYVKLSDGRNAHVIAANPKQLDRPAVQPLDLEGQPKDAALDLATIPTSELSVVRPLPSATG